MRIGVRQRGFTIIEVILFLAVSSALATAILATSAVNINNQRYIDAVRSFKALVQEQYINANRVQNSSSSTTCPSGGPAGDPGTKDCLILGKVLITDTSGKKITIKNIISTGTEPAEYSGNDLSDIKVLAPVVVDEGSDSTEPAWSTSLKAGSTGNTTFSLVIIRSPSSGTPYTLFFDGEDVSSTLNTKIQALTTFPTNGFATICVNRDGLTAAPAQAIKVRYRGSGPNGVEQGDGGGLC